MGNNQIIPGQVKSENVPQNMGTVSFGWQKVTTNSVVPFRDKGIPNNAGVFTGYKDFQCSVTFEGKACSEGCVAFDFCISSWA